MPTMAPHSFSHCMHACVACDHSCVACWLFGTVAKCGRQAGITVIIDHISELLVDNSVLCTNSVSSLLCLIVAKCQVLLTRAAVSLSSIHGASQGSSQMGFKSESQCCSQEPTQVTFSIVSPLFSYTCFCRHTYVRS